jgi:hypothetical protein
MAMNPEPKVVYVPTCEQPSSPEASYPIMSLAFEHLAWPVLGLVAFISLRGRVANVLEAAKKRLEDTKTKVSVTKDGSITFEAVAEGRKEVERQVELLNLDNKDAQVPQGATAEKQLNDMATQYLGRHSDDPIKRRNAKDSIARRMGALVVQNKIPLQSLLDARNEAKLAALAHASMLTPDAGQLDLLAQASIFATLLHVRYALAMAFARLIEAGMVTPNDHFKVFRALVPMRDGADESLQRRIEKTLALLWARA